MAPDSRTPSQDLALVARVLDGDEGARVEFVQRMRCVPRLVARINRKLGRPLTKDEREDVTQDVMVALWRKLPQYRGTGVLEAFAGRFCHLELLASLRRRRRVPQPLEDDACEAAAVPSAEHAALEEYEALYRGLDRLRGEEADVIRLRHLEGEPFEQVAVRLGLALGSAKSLYYRGMLKLRGHLVRLDSHSEESAP